MADEADERIRKFLAEHQYHPRSSKHGDALCLFLLSDLLATCPTFLAAANAGDIVYEMNYTIDPNSVDQWNADLVIGPPSGGVCEGDMLDGLIHRGKPSAVWIAVDAKSIMTEHGKARRNRQRDLNSFQDILHRKNPNTIVCGLLLLNKSERFLSPLRNDTKATVHKNIDRLVTEIIDLMGGIPRSNEPGIGIDALGVIVVSHSNITGEPTVLIKEAPAPTADDPLSYQSCLKDLCSAFSARYSK